MQIGYVVGSLKKQGSTSVFLQNKLLEEIGEGQKFRVPTKNRAVSEAEQNLANCDVLVFSFPLYVDSVPAHMLSWLQKMEPVMRENKCSARVYVVVNCGFFEGHQTRLAVGVIKQWCAKSGLKWGQAVGLGAGPMAQIPGVIGRVLYKPLGKTIAHMGENVKNNRNRSDIYIQPSFPRKLYMWMAHKIFVKAGANNGLRKGDMYRRPTVQ